MIDEGFKVAYERVEELLKSIQKRQHRSDDTQPIDLILSDNQDLTWRLRKIASLRPISDTDAMQEQREIDQNTLEWLKNFVRKSKECHARSDVVALFKVKNLAGHYVDVIAASGDCAHVIASRNNHVREEKNATAYRYKQNQIDKLCRKSPALGQALRAGVPGLVVRVGNYVLVRGTTDIVYTPATRVE